jgi:metallo-beta-lactamase family protein
MALRALWRANIPGDIPKKEIIVKIIFHGAAQTVTGSQHIIEINGSRLLLECGMYQGKRDEAFRRNRNFAFDPHELDAVILSHAHIDHSGNLPNLLRRGYEGQIYATPATGDLTDIMVRDSAHIQEADVEYVNRKRARRGEAPIEPLYTVRDAEQVARQMREIAYLREFEPLPGVTARFFDAGHILGSAGLALDIEEKGNRFRLWFSGDIGRERLPLLEDPALPEAAEYLIMESTYGDKPHHDPEQAYTELKQVISRTAQRGGKVIVPAFSIGRTQELVYWLNRMITEGDLSALPVYVDSPLAVNASQIFSRHAYLFDDETRQFVNEYRHPALNFKGLSYVQSVDESKAINDRRGPLVIISASGMAETGRILHHLRNNIEDSKNTVLIVSWQAPDTLGRRLADRELQVRIFGEWFARRAEVATIGGLSAHAGQDMLVRYGTASRNSLKKVFLVHGEERPAQALKEKLDHAGMREVYYPLPGQEFIL